MEQWWAVAASVVWVVQVVPESSDCLARSVEVAGQNRSVGAVGSRSAGFADSLSDVVVGSWRAAIVAEQSRLAAAVEREEVQS